MAVLFIQQCEPYVFFDQPQPLNKKELKAFPQKMHGVYVNEDSAKLFISASTMIKKSLEYFDVPRIEIDTSEAYRMEGNMLFGPDIDSARILKVVNDTIYGDFYFFDTLFIINASHRLKKLKNNYFLNVQRDSIWEVIKFEINANNLVFHSINHEKELPGLIQHYRVDSTLNDSTNKVATYIIRMNKKEFKQYASSGFQAKEVWQKMNQKNVSW